MKRIVISLVLILILGCKGGKIKYEGIDTTDFSTVSDRGICNEDFIFNMPKIIGSVDSIVFVADVVDGKYIHLFNKNSGKHIESFVAIGRGAGEVVQPMTATLKKDSLVQVFCYATQKMVTYNINSYLAKIPGYFHEQNFANEEMRIADLYYMGNERYLALGDQEIRFAVFNRDGKMEYQYRDYPDLKIDDMEEVHSICNYVPSIAIDTTHNKFVFATVLGCLIEAFEFDESAIRSVKQKFIYEPIYRIVEGAKPKWVTYDEDNGAIAGVLSTQCKGDEIYMAMSGKKSLGPYDNTMFLVYDWDLNLKAGHLISNYTDSFLLDNDNSTIYAFNYNYESEDNTGKLIRFTID